jgi:hypothetical protein
MPRDNRMNKSASTIPYQLRPHKAIDRNIFISILKQLDRATDIDINSYRYVGFGAPFLEDFKLMHLEFGTNDMDCIEYDKHAYTRQMFNNPYYFLKLFNCSSTEYINGEDLKQDINQIIWLDFASPGQFRQQLLDIELLSEKIGKLDIVKFTFNANIPSFISSHHIKKCNPADSIKILKFLREDPTYQNYLPETATVKHITDNFPAVVRAMAVRAINRGLSRSDEEDVTFNHLSSFNYADGQLMTTITGIIEASAKFKNILQQTKLSEWEFFSSIMNDEFIVGNEINVPAMTISERLEIDRKIPVKNINDLANMLTFSYGKDADEHMQLLEGYCRYYKYLPYYSRVTY